jgi:UDP:flavonoid glycosyltransferase YjiC (YdhE family)
MIRERTKVLFIGEGVTLAHVGRPISLADGLDPDRFEVHFACDRRHRHWLADRPWSYQPLASISTEAFLAAVAKGRPMYDIATLESYVRDDTALLRAVNPAIVVGDFRLSLSVSARIVGVPYVAISNAYWSPYTTRNFPIPEHWTTRVLGLRIATDVFRLVRPLVFARHAAPLNAVRRRYGLPSLGSDLRRINTDADLVAYSDIPAMVPTSALPPSHQYIGPVLWSPPVGVPSWWERVPPRDGRTIYVNMGSSGPPRLLSVVLEALGPLPYRIIVASAGKPIPPGLPTNVWAAQYLPGDLMTSKAAAVICNGGSPTSQQALTAGVPVLGIASNMDQLMNMHAVVRYGAGQCLRADNLSVTAISQSVRSLLEEPSARDAARRAAMQFAEYPANARFLTVLRNALERRDGVAS